MNTPYEVRQPSKHDDYYLHDKDGVMQAVTASYKVAKEITETVNKHDKLTERTRNFRRALDSIGSLSGRCSAGHDADCPCGYCLINRMALSALKNE